jgi:hypothetical protein
MSTGLSFVDLVLTCYAHVLRYPQEEWRRGKCTMATDVGLGWLMVGAFAYSDELAVVRMGWTQVSRRPVAPCKSSHSTRIQTM